jgi:hypothetical protein
MAPLMAINGRVAIMGRKWRKREGETAARFRFLKADGRGVSIGVLGAWCRSVAPGAVGSGHAGAVHGVGRRRVCAHGAVRCAGCSAEGSSVRRGAPGRALRRLEADVGRPGLGWALGRSLRGKAKCGRAVQSATPQRKGEEGDGLVGPWWALGLG